MAVTPSKRSGPATIVQSLAMRAVPLLLGPDAIGCRLIATFATLYSVASAGITCAQVSQVPPPRATAQPSYCGPSTSTGRTSRSPSGTAAGRGDEAVQAISDHALIAKRSFCEEHP